MAHCAVHRRCIHKTLQPLYKILNYNQYLNRPVTKTNTCFKFKEVRKRKHSATVVACFACQNKSTAQNIF